MNAFASALTPPPRRIRSAWLAAAAMLGFLAPAGLALAQQEEAMLEEVTVVGIRQSLESALEQKRAAANLIEVIEAEDIGKLPDQNLAEVLENVTGIQITREAGVGTGVQIRGTNANRTEINGVSTVGSGAGRDGIDYEDISAAIISAVEVVKAPEAKTIEGSVGGTINLRTIRPLELTEMLGVGRLQFEESSLSTDSRSPRISGAWGDNWDTGMGDIGIIVSGSSTEQDVSAFRPRADRDNLILASDSMVAADLKQDFDFIPIQFFIQDYDNFEYETTNLAISMEWAPSDNVKMFFDQITTEQERLQESSRIQASGVSSLRRAYVPDEFEGVCFGALTGREGRQELGCIQAALKGTIPAEDDVGGDPNLRTSTDSGSRITDSDIFRLGLDWEGETFSGRVEWSSSESSTRAPGSTITLNFINPQHASIDESLAPSLRGLADCATSCGNDNGTPFQYDLSGGSLEFGIAHSEANAPTVAELLDPENYRLRDFGLNNDKRENEETAFVLDFTWELDWPLITSLDFGYRQNTTSSMTDEIRTNLSLRQLDESPPGNLFANVLASGPSNFDDGDGRDLFVPHFLVVNPEAVASDPGGVRDSLNAALAMHHTAVTTANASSMADLKEIEAPTSRQSAFFDIEEETTAMYVQANFEVGNVRGNLGLRQVETDVTSVGNRILNDDMAVRTSTKGSYDFLLPRFNMVVDVTDNLDFRLGWGKDIRRPDFDDLSTSFSFDTSPNPAVELGNPALKPQEVESFDIAAAWHFADAAVLSVGYFHKTRSGLFVTLQENPLETPNESGDSRALNRDITDPCEDGGIFNPIADPNVFAPTGTPAGVCVPISRTVNGGGQTTQKGIEVAFQWDLSAHTDGWLSGFGALLNFTTQEFSGTDEFYDQTSRAGDVFAATTGNPDFGDDSASVSLRTPLIDLSEKAYNVTLYYEKYGISARWRYTWREAYRSTDYGSTSSHPWGFPVVQGDRGQMNLRVGYTFLDNWNVDLEIINLTEEEVEQHCVNEGALLCYQGITDRRTTIGASYRF